MHIRGKQTPVDRDNFQEKTFEKSPVKSCSGGGIDCDSTDSDGSLFLSNLTSGPVKFHGMASLSFTSTPV